MIDSQAFSSVIHQQHPVPLMGPSSKTLPLVPRIPHSSRVFWPLILSLWLVPPHHLDPQTLMWTVQGCFQTLLFTIYIYSLK